MTTIAETKFKSLKARVVALTRQLKTQLDTEHKLIAESEKIKESYEAAMHRVAQLEDRCGWLGSANDDLNLKIEQLEVKLEKALDAEPDCWRVTAPTYCGHVTVDKGVAEFWLGRNQAYPLFRHADAAKPNDSN